MEMKLKKLISAVVIFIFITSQTFASTLVSGKLVSSDLLRPIMGANIYPSNNLQNGTTSNQNGYFSLTLTSTSKEIIISLIGYEKQSIQLNESNADKLNLDTIKLSPQTIDLEEIKIFASIAEKRKTPVSVTTIKAEMIEKKLGDQTYPEILKQTPGIYATRTGGGSGDARVSLRGFRQENIALLLNGIPISSVENGLVYWNNWIGLAEATKMIQVQKGLGASKVALNSLGGTINIITKSTETKKGGSIQHSMTSYGNQKTTFSFSTGLMDNGWAMTFLGSRTSGDGYIDATYVDGWSYFLSTGKQFGKKHKIVLTLLGAPEKHGQRNFMLSQTEVDQYGIKFNKDWGSYNGELNNASENFYHKPQLSINHYWNINKKTFLATSAYISVGNGGGKWTESFNYGSTLFQYRNPSQQIDWESVYNLNANNTDIFDLGGDETVNGYSKIIQTNFLASHIWTGVLSNLEYKINDNFKLISGFHYRYFKSKLQEKVRDLLGGNFWIDNYAWALEGAGGRNKIKAVGDVINVDNGALIHFGHIFNQLEYNTNHVNAFIAASASKTWYQREDRYNYLSNTKSVVVTKPGFDLKGGLNINLDDLNNLYFNMGYYSKAPLFKFVFPNYNNSATIDISNEHIFAMELGYGLKTDVLNFKANAYYTYWSDVSILSKEYIQLEDNSQTRALVKGLDALHMGIEVELGIHLKKNLEIGLMTSLGNWKWKNDVVADIFDINNNLVGTTEVYANGLKVGDAPQTQMGVFLKSMIFNTFSFELDWTFNDHLYADFDPTNRGISTDRQQSFQLPSYHLVDVHFGYSYTLFNNQAFIGINAYNLFNTNYIMRGQDGANHNLDTFLGYWGFERTFNIQFKLNF